MNNLEISQADPTRLGDLVGLLDAYRVFYGQPSDPAAAEAFLADRLEQHDSLLLIADQGAAAVGFTQLYPSYSSVAMQRVWIVNDLFVSPEARRRGVGRQLLEAAARHAEQSGAARLSLATARDNLAGKSLYEGAGWSIDRQFDHYNLAVRSE